MRKVITFDFDDTLLELAVKRDAEGDIVDVHVTNREKNPRNWPHCFYNFGPITIE